MAFFPTLLSAATFCALAQLKEFDVTGALDDERCDGDDDASCESLKMLQRRANRSSEANNPTGRHSSSVLCSEMPTCGALNLKGYCCPSAAGVSLDCCYNQRHQQIRECLQVGRQALENCPAHVDAADMRPEDVEAVCQESCQKELLPLSVECGVDNFARTFKVLCAHPETTATVLRKMRQQDTCVNAHLKTSSTCPPHIRIVTEILKNQNPKDTQILCSDDCYPDMARIFDNCTADELQNKLSSLCSDQDLTASMAKGKHLERVKEDFLYEDLDLMRMLRADNC
mmetsp:Transcript_68819/g.139539  ORF Transcript_68819/g.139539 Transcript_68819/m.139539 type:complete len:285 (-) Transcript_68819:42-896(-)